jgi:PAS domain S-box-containing protein
MPIILIADNDPAFLEKSKALFEGQGHKVLFFPDGHRAYEGALQAKPDVVLLAAGLPGLDGFGVCRKLKGANAYAHVPVLIITDSDSAGEQSRCLEAGAFGCICRSVSPEALRAKIEGYLKVSRIERDLKAGEFSYRVIFENSAVAITVADNEGQVILWNKFAEHMLARLKDTLFMAPVSSLYPPEEWERMKRENIRQKGMQHHFETRIVRGDGKNIDVDISLTVLRDADGNISGSIGVIRDISERRVAEAIIRRAKEAAESANRTKGAFLYRLSQEVVKPMEAITEMLVQLSKTPLTDTQKDIVHKTRVSAGDLKAMLDDIYLVFKELKEEKFLKVD